VSVERLKEMLANSPFPWWEWDVRANLVTYSPLKTEMLHFDSSRFLDRGYQGFVELVHPDDYEQTMDAMRRLLQGETSLYQTDYRILDAHGEYHWYVDRGITIESSLDGSPLVVRGIVIDIGVESQHTGSPHLVKDAILNSLIEMNREPKSFLTVCAGCGLVKARSKEYVSLSADLFALLSEQVSHSICPSCMKRLYPELEGLGNRPK